MITQKEILEAIADNLGLPTADIDPGAHLQEDLGLNPIEKADLLNALAEQFKVIFIPGESEQVKTVSQLIELVEDKLLE